MKRLEYIKRQLSDLEKMAENYPRVRYFIAMAAVDASETLEAVQRGQVTLNPSAGDQGDFRPN